MEQALVNDPAKFVLVRMCRMRLMFNKFFHNADHSYYFSVFEDSRLMRQTRERVYEVALQEKYNDFISLPNKFNRLL